MSNIATRETGPEGTEFLVRTWPNESAHATLLLVHGVYEHSGRWDHVGTFFQERGFEVQAYDLRGHGHTSGAQLDVAPFERHLDDLAWRLEAVRPKEGPLVVYAHSMGGLISTYYATTQRAQPDAWVWSAPALGSSISKALMATARVLGRVAPGLRMSDKPDAEMLSSDPAVGEAYFADPLVRFKGTVRMANAAFDAMDVVNANIEKIRTPALTIHGTDDTLVPPAVSAPLTRSASVERKLFGGLRHEMHNEPRAAEVMGFADDWLRSQIGG